MEKSERFNLPDIDFNNIEDIKSKMHKTAYILFYEFDPRICIMDTYNDPVYIMSSQGQIVELAFLIMKNLRDTIMRYDSDYIDSEFIEFITELYDTRKELFKVLMERHLTQLDLYKKK
jgi:hypothetical protein